LILSAYALAAGLVLYSISKAVLGIRLSDEQQRRGADLAIHSIRANPEGEV
jgi:Amt family ammonium transporter